MHIIILNKKNFSYVEIDLEKKPLYIYKNSKNLVFGSSIDYILNITKLNHEIDKKQIELYLKNGFRSLFFDIKAKSFFKEINTLEPGFYYEINNRFKIEKKNIGVLRVLEY